MQKQIHHVKSAKSGLALQEFNRVKKILFILSATLSLFGFVLPAYAAPAVTGVSGTIADGQTINITGTGFGSKPLGAPFMWDDCSGTNILDLWDNYVPGNYDSIFAYDSAKNLAYRTPEQAGRGVALPHSHITKYMCGAHYFYFTEDGSNLFPWKYKELSSSTVYTYVSWYRRIDPNWVWGSEDHNFKDICWCNNNEFPYYNCNNYITHYETTAPYYEGVWEVNFPGPSSTISLAHERLENKWVKTEFEAYWSTSSGYLKIWEDGILKMFYEGNTLVGGTPNTIALEGFWRTPNENNWRYLADIYIDYTAQRVLISNASTLENSTTLREIQIPSAWADDGKTNGSIITAEVNQGGFADGQDVWLYVFDQYGTPSDQNSGVSGTQGYHIQFAGNSGDNVAPSTPSGLSVN